MVGPPGKTVRFGLYEANFETGELRKAGIRIKMQDQPMRVLVALLERPGELVTREELQRQLWPEVEYLDFEHGLNMAVKKLRAALNDSADTPRYVETLARKGYRFIAPVETPAPQAEAAPVPEPLPVAGPAPATGRHWKWTVIGISAAAILVAATGVIRQAMKPKPVVTPLISNSGSMHSLTFSPDGRQLAFVITEKGSPSRIFVSALTQDPARRVTDDDDPAHNEILPAWMPDGGGISYFRGGSRRGLFAVPPGGGTPRKLMDLVLRNGYCWLPDGRNIVAAQSDAEGRSAIFRIAVPGGQQQRLSTPPLAIPSFNGRRVAGDWRPSCSPDGKWVIFMRELSDASVVMIMPAAGGEARRLVRDSGEAEDGIGDVAWIPGGREVLIDAKLGAPFQSLYRVSLASGRPEPIVGLPLGTELGQIALSPSGDRLVYSIEHTHGSIRRYSLGNSVETPGRTSVAAPHEDVAPAVSPDGKRMAFASDRSGNFQIYVAGVDGSHPVPLTSFAEGMAGWPRWSPDGKRISFDARPAGRAQIFTVDADGGEPHALTTPPGDAVMPEWSPDGGSLYYTLLDPSGKSDIWKVPATGGKRIRVTNMGGFGALPSADGATLYVGVHDRYGIYAAPAAGGEAAFLPGSEGIVSFSGARSGFYGIAVAKARGAQQQLVRFNYMTRVFEPVMLLPRPAFAPGLAVFADEKQILVAEDEGTVSQLMLIDHFR